MDVSVYTRTRVRPQAPVGGPRVDGFFKTRRLVGLLGRLPPAVGGKGTAPRPSHSTAARPPAIELQGRGTSRRRPPGDTVAASRTARPLLRRRAPPMKIIDVRSYGVNLGGG